eukprot:TRINITY_DN5501_c0_g1_i2.p1 TRINITY_DN5501_c0_g1~~TRINITY_DN5501_c0_g1_i2.p1  ORF type:complete len:579 (-),score=247.48 TRINITY_DN5501_c0_g1_i2:1454-3190(-)
MQTEMGFTVLVAAMLVARTYCDLWMISNTTQIESLIISRNARDFPKGIVRLLLAMLPIAVVNCLLKYGLGEMALRFRNRLTQHLYKKYLTGFTYYKVSNLDNRISNPDHLLTQDLEKFCQSMADLYSNVSKPLLDILIYARKLGQSIGFQGPMYMLAYLAASGFILTGLRRPLGKYTVTEQRLEGEFRYVNSRLLTNSEEIAFYQGNKKETVVIFDSFHRLVKHLRKAMRFRFSMGIVDNIVAKYFATVVGFYVVSRPFLDMNHPRHMHSSQAEIMEDYYKSGRMLVNLATAVGRLVLAGRELTRLAGFTARVTELINVLDELNKGVYKRTMVTSSDPDSLELKPNSGTIIYQDKVIEFDSVPLVTPNCDVLIRSLSFKVDSGMNVLVCGPNGCGKSSLFRTLGELWPLFGGTMRKPKGSKLFYVPQRPYMTLGTLRDQIIYPHSREEMLAEGHTDAELQMLLNHVHLGYLKDREDGFDAVQDWMDVLSGGEKQRVAMARLFYHRPQFAILDECTSAVSVDVEGFMYSHCREIGITLFTVSHRKSLWKWHEFVLQFDGRGEYEFKKIDKDDDEGVFGS